VADATNRLYSFTGELVDGGVGGLNQFGNVKNDKPFTISLLATSP
jgi:hypothetical protein